jgi:hypothetical protein
MTGESGMKIARFRLSKMNNFCKIPGQNGMEMPVFDSKKSRNILNMLRDSVFPIVAGSILDGSYNHPSLTSYQNSL